MNASNLGELPAAENSGTRSRFAYHSELEPVEGGVSAVPAASDGGDTPGQNTRKPGRGSNGTASATGLPNPEDRLLDISEIARNVGQYYTHHFSLSHRAGDELDTETPITGEVTLTNSGAALILRGHAQTRLRLECGRCLRPVVEPVETDIEEEFDLVAEHSARSYADEVRAVDEDETGSVIDGNVLDLGDLLRQYLLLAAPLTPHCHGGCVDVPMPESVGVFLPAGAVAPPATLAPDAAADNPLRRLAELLAAKERGEE